MVKYNLKLLDWGPDDVDKIIKKAEKLSTSNDAVVFKDIAASMKENESNAYTACIMICKEAEYSRYMIMMFLGYDSGDEIFTETAYAPFDDEEKLRSVISKLYQKYHDEKVLTKLISYNIDEKEENNGQRTEREG